MPQEISEVCPSTHRRQGKEFKRHTSNSKFETEALRTDNGAEYLSSEFKHFLAQNGIDQKLTVAYTPQKKGVAEQMYRTLMDLLRSSCTAKVGKAVLG